MSAEALNGRQKPSLYTLYTFSKFPIFMIDIYILNDHTIHTCALLTPLQCGHVTISGYVFYRDHTI